MPKHEKHQRGQRASAVRDGRLAYLAALEEMYFPEIPWTARGGELLFRLCEIVEDHLELLTTLAPAERPLASSSSEPMLLTTPTPAEEPLASSSSKAKFMLSVRVKAELAQNLLE